MTPITIALDAMGGDIGPAVVVPAALQVLAQQQNLCLILVGDKDTLTATLKSHQAAENETLKIRHASQQVGMDESPALAMRNKKDSSMRIAIELVRDGTARACVSAGNTGAFMATSRYVLKTLPGIDRPALVARLPTIKGNRVRVLDLGANVDSKPEHLLQFAIMGSVLTSAAENITRPRLGLLNIGEEEIKGNDLVKQTTKLLQECQAINYIGYVEGDAIYQGVADIVICDGFVGNVMLKASEGLAGLLKHYIRETFNQNIVYKFLGFILSPLLKASLRHIDPARYNGASFLGLQGIVIKSHGSAGVLAFANAIQEAILEVKKDVPKLIRDQVEKLLAQESSNA